MYIRSPRTYTDSNSRWCTFRMRRSHATEDASIYLQSKQGLQADRISVSVSYDTSEQLLFKVQIAFAIFVDQSKACYRDSSSQNQWEVCLEQVARQGPWTAF